MSLPQPPDCRDAGAGESRRPPAGQAAAPADGCGGGWTRSVRLFRLFRREQTDPGAFYQALAQDAVSQVERYGQVSGRTVVDIGGGAGYFGSAFRARGACYFLFEPDHAELNGSGQVPPGAVVANGYWLPVRDGGADICFSSNVLEHVADPLALIDELVRATRAGGLIYISFTNWYSPWGGHEMSPWHYLGSTYAERRYVRHHHQPPKHAVGTNLFRLHVGPTLRLLRSRDDVEILDALPRYYPRWCRPLVRIPGLREVATWNLLIVLRRNG
jgi:SAM-dependent methyltransferase